MKIKIKVKEIDEKIFNNETIRLYLNNHYTDMTEEDVFNLHSLLGYLLKDLQECRLRGIEFEQGDIVL